MKDLNHYLNIDMNYYVVNYRNEFFLQMNIIDLYYFFLSYNSRNELIERNYFLKIYSPALYFTSGKLILHRGVYIHKPRWTICDKNDVDARLH